MLDNKSPLLYNNPVKVLLKNHQAPGDTLMMTCAVRDLKKAYPHYQIKVDTTAPRIWDNNPYLSDFNDPDLVLNVGPKIATQGSKTSGLHFANAFRICLEANFGRTIPQGLIKPDIHLSEWEQNKPPIIEGDYWLITAGGKPDFSAKIWPFERWQEVVNRLPWITFVQLGCAKHRHSHLGGKNVLDFIGKTEDPETGFRDLFNLFLHCQGSAGLVSLQMHLAAAFDKPCVVVAGSREPSQWEAYPSHRYLHNQGALRCTLGASFQQGPLLLDSCWRAKTGACTNKVESVPKCIDMITVEDVVRSIETYYEGGRLAHPEKKATYIVKKRPVFRIICNAHGFMGGERSSVNIMMMMQKKGYDLELVPTKGVSAEFKRAIGGVKVTNKVTSPCDVLFFYTNDTIWEFHTQTYNKFTELKAERKYMGLNFRIGKAGHVAWTKNWNGYFFLNTTLRDQFIKIYPEAITHVLAPPVNLEPFLRIEPKYNKTLHLLRHSSQGDSKFPKDFGNIVENITKVHPSIKMSFMPAPSFLKDLPSVSKHRVNALSVPEFLAEGNCFWYILPTDYSDMGPRVIVEAMAAGLPVIADNKDGAKDRITPETGWLCNTAEEYYDIVKGINHLMLEDKGKAAKERARKEFDPNKWIDILGEDS